MKGLGWGNRVKKVRKEMKEIHDAVILVGKCQRRRIGGTKEMVKVVEMEGCIDFMANLMFRTEDEHMKEYLELWGIKDEEGRKSLREALTRTITRIGGIHEIGSSGDEEREERG